MINKLQRDKISWLLIALMALVASSIGVARQGIYRNFRIAAALPAMLSQDLIAVSASLTMLFLIVRIKEGDLVERLILFGIAGYLFYVYGLYVVGKIYNTLYLLYMAIFSLSFYSLVFGIANIGNEASDNIRIPKTVRRVSAVFLFLIPIIFYPLWIVSMWPFIRETRVPEANSNVYILDMCFLLPVFAMMAVMLLRGSHFAILLTPALLIKGFTLGLSVALAEFLKPFYKLTWNAPFALLFGFLTLASLGLTLLYFKKASYRDVISRN